MTSNPKFTFYEKVHVHTNNRDIADINRLLAAVLALTD